MGLTRENLSSGFANNTGADQTVHPRTLISAFVIRVLESSISKLATSEISFHLIRPDLVIWTFLENTVVKNLDR